MNKLTLFPNQSAIEIHKTDPGKHYALYKRDAIEKAARELPAAAFKLWTCLSLNKDGFIFGLSQKDFENKYGMKKKQFHNAVQILKEKGYIKSGFIAAQNLEGLHFFDEPRTNK